MFEITKAKLDKSHSDIQNINYLVASEWKCPQWYWEVNFVVYNV